MTDNDHPDAIAARTSLQPLSPTVFEGIELGNDSARSFFTDKPSDGMLFAHIVRYEAVHHIKANSGVLNCVIKRNSMSGVEIFFGDYCARIWKKYDDPEHFLQPPGESERRQRFYQQGQMRINEFAHLLPPSKNVVYVWERMASGGVAVWLVAPSGFEEIWKPGDCEWSIKIPHPAEQMAPTTDFEAEDDEGLPLSLDETGESNPDDEPEE